MPIIKNLRVIAALKRFFDKEKFDIVQTHFPDSEIIGAIAARLSKHRSYLLGTRRNLYHWVKEQPLGFIAYKYVNRWLNVVLVNSYKVAEKCKEIERIPESKIKVIQNGVDLSRFNNISSAAAKKNIGLDSNYPVIGVVGNWRAVKGLNSFLTAAAKVHSELPASWFVLVGHGDQKNELINRCTELGIIDSMLFLERPPKVNEIIQAFDIAVQPSLSESFSNVLVEYMAAGKPIVATRVGDAERVIEEGKTGLLVDPGNPEQLSAAIIKLGRNREMCLALGNLVRERVESNWSKEAMLEKYELFYKKIVE